MAFVRLLALETIGGVGVHVPQTEHGGDHVGALHEGSSGRRHHIGVSGRIDHYVAQDRLPAGLGLAYHTLDGPTFHDRPGVPGVQAQVDPLLLDQIVGDPLPAVRVERDRIDDRLDPPRLVEVEHSPAGPAPPEGLAADPIGRRRVDRQTDRLETIHHLLGDPAHGDLVLVHEVVEDQYHPSGGHPAEVGVPLDQDH